MSPVKALNDSPPTISLLDVNQLPAVGVGGVPDRLQTQHVIMAPEGVKLSDGVVLQARQAELLPGAAFVVPDLVLKDRDALQHGGGFSNCQNKNDLLHHVLDHSR